MFSLHGAKWGGGELGVESGPVYWSADSFSDLRFDEDRYSEEDFEQTLEDAFQAWEDVSGIDFEKADAENSADITVGTDELAGSTVGLASWSARGAEGELNEIVSARITFDTEPNWAPEGGGGVDFFAVAAHEIGHALGLGHVNDTSELLNPTIATDELGDGDIAGAQALYGLAATDDGDGAPAPNPDPDTPAPDDDEPAPDTDPPEEEPSGDGGDDGGGGGAGALLAVAGLGVAAVVLGLMAGAGAAAAAVVGGAALAFGGGGGGGSGGTLAGQAEEDDGTETFDLAACAQCGSFGCDCDAQDEAEDIFPSDDSETVSFDLGVCVECGSSSCGCGSQDDANATDAADDIFPQEDDDPLPSVALDDDACLECGFTSCGCDLREDDGDPGFLA